MYAAGQWRLPSYSFTDGSKMSKMARTLLGLIFAVLIKDFLFAEGFDVRLINNLDNCFGRVEVLHNGTWGTVCGESWGISDAAVVCKHLNCGRAVTAHTWALFGEGSGPIFSPVTCKGVESSIKECFLKPEGFEPSDCLHNQDAGVVCSASLLVIISAVIIAVVFLLCVTIIIILVVRRKRSRQKQQISSSDCIQDVVTMHDVPHKDRYKESDDDDDDDNYEKVDVDGDHEDLNSNTEEDYVNMNEPVQTNVRSDHSEQDVNVETEDSEGDYVNVESEDSERDYVNVEITEDGCKVDNNF